MPGNLNKNTFHQQTFRKAELRRLALISSGEFCLVAMIALAALDYTWGTQANTSHNECNDEEFHRGTM
jgi:hypothetical protein